MAGVRSGGPPPPGAGASWRWPGLGNQAAIVRLSYCPANPVRRIALVGKGICHDSGATT